MARQSPLELVDAHRFRDLFVEELGWSSPDQSTKTVTVEDRGYPLTQVARFEGLRVWWCDQLPARKQQRAIDAAIARDDVERLVIFTGDGRQEWRWPRRAQTGGVPAKLLVHEHVEGDVDEHLSVQLEAIRLNVTESVNLVELLRRMRGAFDQVAESNSVKAARLMRSLYSELQACGVGDHDATLLLARVLFLMFGDDTFMWDPRERTGADMFANWLANDTTAQTLHTDLAELFEVLNEPTTSRPEDLRASYEQFRYVNGGLFEDRLRLPVLSEPFRDALLAACDFGWAVISPAVFGSMFQTVKDRQARRQGGEHYTTEANILKTLRPLFLDELRDRLEKAWNSKAELTKLHNDIARLKVMDPACGCGNFLIVAYRELRALELDLVRQRRALDAPVGWRDEGQPVQKSMLSSDFETRVRLDHFAGIEIEEWPAQIARTAMLLVDHLANLEFAEEFSEVPDRLPIKVQPRIERANALHTSWASVMRASDDVIVVGNPPFGGDRKLTEEQKRDLRTVWGDISTSHLDYVTGWHAKALDYFEGVNGKWAFVATNSICQGEPVSYLWEPIRRAGWRARFAHRSFQWTTEAADGAAVHVSIVGFDRGGRAAPRAQLWTYPEGGRGEGVCSSVELINPYLLDAPDVLVRSHRKPISQLPEIMFGNMPRTKELVVEPEAYEEAMSDPIAAQYVRPYVGTDELVKGKQRWCLWLEDATPAEISASPFLNQRVEGSRKARMGSKALETRAMAKTAHLFAQRTQPRGPVLIIPRVVSEHRDYFTAEFSDGTAIASDSAFCGADPDGFAFAVLSSSMFMAWMRGVGGRLESRPRFSKTFTYNAFPLPRLNAEQRAKVVLAGVGLLAARRAHPGMPLNVMYAKGRVPTDVQRAHDELDLVVDGIFGCKDRTTLGRQRLLLNTYDQYVRATHTLV